MGSMRRTLEHLAKNSPEEDVRRQAAEMLETPCDYRMVEVDLQSYRDVRLPDLALDLIARSESAPIQNWQSAESYPQKLNGQGWAWEFLRRSPKYRKDFSQALHDFYRLLVMFPDWDGEELNYWDGLEDWKKVRFRDLDALRRAKTSKRTGTSRVWCPLDDKSIFVGAVLDVRGGLEFKREKDYWQIASLINPLVDSPPSFTGAAAPPSAFSTSALSWEAGGAVADKLLDSGDHSRGLVVASIVAGMYSKFPSAVRSESQVTATFELAEALEPQLERIGEQLKSIQTELADADLLAYGRPRKRIRKDLFPCSLLLLDAEAAGASIEDVADFYAEQPEALKPKDRDLDSSTLRKRLSTAKSYLNPPGYLRILAAREEN